MSQHYSLNTSADEMVTLRSELDVHSRGRHTLSGRLGFIDGLDDEDCFELAALLLLAGGFDDSADAARRARFPHPQSCTGTRYLVNPDYPDEGYDLHHDGPCPVHAIASR